ncbi:MAG: hypothetical protein IJ379_00385 [Lachnospiraceae bacterium]|nr:hypothetical protein [Lachnospiraceae bacterium]
MKKTMKRLVALLASAVVMLGSSLVVSAEEGYTYNFDYWGDVQYSPDAYTVAGVYTAADLGLEQKMINPQGLYVYGDMIYICDTGNNRILELERTGMQDVEVIQIIDSFNGNGLTEVTTFNTPTDIARDEEGCYYIADKNNGRILKLDSELNYIMEFTKPTDATFDQALNFLPSKITIDTAGRVYCVADNVNKGLIKFEADGVFSGFVGATEVTYEFVDYIWKRIATSAQRAQMTNFVPTEYDNLYMDHEGFIYACTTNVSEPDLDAGTAKPMRRLNMMGTDIMVRNGEWYIIGDIHWGSGGGYSGPSLIIDITAFDNDVFVGLDKVRGRLFAYDDQGRMLYAFGGNGNVDGYFKQPVALDHMDRDLLVLDSLDCSVTIFTPTEFGNTIFDAIEQFQDGYYTESGESWQKVMNMNGNYDLAYIGIGRSLLRQEKYEEAMDYFELKWDADNYSKAFKQYRKIWVEEHIIPIIIVVFGVICLPLIIGKIKKIKHEIDTADIFKV